MQRIEMRRRDGSLAGVFTIDDADLEFVSARRWSLSAQGYPVAKIDGRVESLHRVLLGLEPGDGLFGDHVNGDQLDNRRANLRAVTPAQSAQNVSGRNDIARGVSWDAQRGRWKVQGSIGGRNTFVGRYESLDEAVAAAREFRAEHQPFAVEREAPDVGRCAA